MNDSVTNICEAPANVTKIRRGVYVVRTQAGYRKALRDYFGEKPSPEEAPRNFPRNFPALITLSVLSYQDRDCVHCEVFHFKELHAILAAHDIKPPREIEHVD